MVAWLNADLYKLDKKIGKTPLGFQKKGGYTYKISATEPELLTKPKKGFERRNLHITHPLPQLLLAKEISENWNVVSKWLCRRKYSSDEIRISQDYERSIKGINFPLHRARVSYLESSSDWLVKTDISRFYPTIYTHSIAWAAYGKEKVKENIGLYKGSLADRLDILVRACNRNQTVGIPIGPETSRIIAEVISSRVDEDFSRRISYIDSEYIDRLQDDWNVGVNSLEEAENVISVINRIYREFGLEINGNKTSIEHILFGRDLDWVSELNSFLSHGKRKLGGARLKEFLSICVSLQTKNPTESVVSYALSVIESQKFDEDSVEYLESFLLKAMVIAPDASDRICRILINLKFKNRNISSKRVSERFLKLAEKNLEKGNVYEAIWQIYTIRGLKRPVFSRTIGELVEGLNSSALSLILLDMQDVGVFLGGLPKDKWEKDISIDQITGSWIWLLAYEGIRHGWLSDNKNVSAHPLFKEMYDRDIVFYDRKRNVKTSISTARKSSKFRWTQILEVIKHNKVARGLSKTMYLDFNDY